MLSTAALILSLTFLAGGHAEEANDSDSFIYDGTPAAPGSLPYMVAIILDVGYYKGINCGATILTSTKILAAAHCFESFYGGFKYYAGVGYDDLKTGDKRPGAQLIKVVSFEAPKEYKEGAPSRELVGDIAVATLERPIVFSKTVKPVVLGGQTKAQLMGKSGFVPGWGLYSDEKLMIANGQKVSPDDTSMCKALMKNKPLLPSIMCVTHGGQETCKGDSGGPFMVNGKQEGLVSWGPTCGRGLPGYYTNLGSYKKWVLARMK